MTTPTCQREPSDCRTIARQSDFFSQVTPPVIAAYGAGVDSTAMLIELLERGDRVDIALFADTGSEDPATYAYLSRFERWLDKHGVPLIVVRYEPKNFKNWPAYRTLEENCLTNGTLPSKAFGFGSCSIKWKVAPQNHWTQRWAPAQAIWAAGGRVIKLIGYDCSPADNKRYAEAEGYDDVRYDYRYPLRELGWDRRACEERIIRAGLPLPTKSACYFCPVTKPHELHRRSVVQLRRIVLMEARAKPRLRTVQGLWRTAVKGCRGAQARPGSMTEYIRVHGLLPVDDMRAISDLAPTHLVRWQAHAGELNPRPEMREWLALFDASAGRLHLEGLPDLYPDMAPNRASIQASCCSA